MLTRFLILACAALLPNVAAAQEPAKPRLDAHGVPLPDGAVARLGSTRFASTDHINTVAVSPDGKWIAAGGQGITIWNAETAQLSRTLTGSEGTYPTALTWSANGKLLASINQRQGYQIWDVAKGKAIGPASPRKIEGLDRLTDFRFVAGDKLLALVLNGRRVELWDVARGKLSHTLDMDREKRTKLKEVGEDYELRHIAFSPSGNRLAWLASQPADAAKSKSVVLVYEAETEKLLHVVKELPHADSLILPDEGETVVLVPAIPKKRESATNLSARVVEIPTGKVRFTFDYRLAPSPYQTGLSAFDEEIERVLIAKWGYRFRDSLVIHDGLGYIRWDWNTGRKLDEFTTSSSGYIVTPDRRRQPTRGDFVVTPDGKRLVIGSGQRLFVSDGDLATLARQGGFAAPPVVHFRADGHLEGLDEFPGPRPNQLLVWDVRKGALVERVHIHGWPPESKERHHELPSARLVVYHSRDGSFIVHDRVADRRVSKLDVTGGKDAYPILSNDGKRVLLSGYGKESHLVRWYDAATGRELGRHQIRKGAITNDAGREYDHEWFAADGSVFGYLTWDFRLALVNCEKGTTKTIGVTRLFGRQRWHYKSVGYDRMILAYMAEFSELKKGQQGTFELWDREGKLLRHFRAPVSDETYEESLVVSPDGRAMLAPNQGSTQFDLYETATGKKRGHIPYKHVSRFPDFSPDGTLVAAGSPDNTVLLWDAVRPLGSKPDLPPPTNAKETEKLWQLLADPDPIEAHPALRALTRAPAQTLTLMKQSWLKPAETDDASNRLRDLRALEVLERIGGDDAKKMVEAIAKGEAQALTHEANLVLKRWPEAAKR